jgi:hypothetical protein
LGGFSWILGNRAAFPGGVPGPVNYCTLFTHVALKNDGGGVFTARRLDVDSLLDLSHLSLSATDDASAHNRVRH